MSPILVRPVREQLEHDRVIRLLQAKYKRKFEVAINPGQEQTTPVGNGPSPWYPDLVLLSQERGRKLLGVIEVETAESVNHLEAMSQWAALSRVKAPLYLYVPASMVDTARRLCMDMQIPVAEIWSYNWLGDQLRYILFHRSGNAPEEKPRPAAAAAPKARPAKAEAARAANGSPRCARPAASGAGAAGARRAAAPAAAARRKPAAKPRPDSARPRAGAAKTASRAGAAKKPSPRAQKRK